ncbi:6298_t:CDS:2 [Dentiscutata erythropus]|uniref:6298_t:CDS:1 n=1 Tax=Dentiscutata erythropus TaxID=1348616 RepID=A0A9N9IL15_9GLOM|nr:6298_t:CDS:2 [Dentiscutata erythropus]
MSFTCPSSRKYGTKGLSFGWNALINISPVYRGFNLSSCKQSNNALDLDPVCHAWIASLVLSWILFVTYFVSIIFTWRASKERLKTGIDLSSLPSPKSPKSPKSYLEKYEQKLSELEQHEQQVPQVITIPVIDKQSMEVKQDVPQQQTQLLLQSGLPDQGIPLQIVLPHSSFQTTSQDFENDESEHQEESQISDEVSPPVISITLAKDDKHDDNFTDSNLLNVPSKPKSETSSLHEVPL